MIDAEKLLIDKMYDLQRLCERDFEPQFSDFLDGAEQAIVKRHCHMGSLNTRLFGGFDDAEKKVLGVFPEWMEPGDYPIKILKIEHSFGGELSHRDYLGSVLGLGIERSKTGDILIDGNIAYVFVLSGIAEYIKQNLEKIGSRGVKVSIADEEDLHLPERKFQFIEGVCASPRLDAVIGACTNLSRARAAEMINAGLVKLNHIECEQVAKNVCEGDLMSVRGYGRYILEKVGEETRKGRIHITLKKYI